MKHPLALTAIVFATSAFGIKADTLDNFCLGATPDAQSDALKREFYDNTCPDILQQLQDSRNRAQSAANADSREAKRDSKRENAKADVELLNSATSGLAVSSKDLPDLAAFSSTAKRYISDLGFNIGSEIGQEISKDTSTNGQKTLIIKNPDQAAMWTNKVDVNDVLTQLDSLTADSGDLYKRDNCGIEPKAKYQSKSIAGITLGLAGLKAAMETANYVLDSMQPTLFSSSAVAAPDSLQLSVIAGLQNSLASNKSTHQFLSNPPIVNSSNEVRKRLTKAKIEFEKATKFVDRQSKLPGPNEQLNEACKTEISEKLSRISKNLESLVSANEELTQSSIVAQAERQQAMSDANINNLLQIDLITAGGAVTGYRRNRFTSIKLIASSDISIAIRWFTRESTIKSIIYKSAGCGRAIPLGEFNSKYSASTCLPQRG